MTDKNNESALLLRMNKEEQVSVLQEIGFTNVNENTPASDIAKYIRWAGGLLDLSFATIRIEDGVNVFFTAEEWNSLSANNRSKYLRVGVRIRADRRQFVIAKSDCTDDIGGRTFKWGAYGTDIRGVKNYGNGNQGLYETADGKQNTDAIIEATAGVKDNSGVVGAPAAEAAKNYKACTLEQDGLEDKTEWYLPSEGELITIAKYKTEINELLSSVSGNQNIITTDWYWSSTEYDSSSAWCVNMSYGNVYVAQIAMGASQEQTLKAISEAEAYPGPSLIIAYSPCLNHGIKGGLGNSQMQAKRAVEAGYWSLYHYDPRRIGQGENPFVLDSKEPSNGFREFLLSEVRYSSLKRQFPERAEMLYEKAEADAKARRSNYTRLANK